MRRIGFAVAWLIITVLPTVALALPKALSAPGGVALVTLGEVGDAGDSEKNRPPPRAWLGEQPVLVVAEDGRWTAVVGLALDTPTGWQTLRVKADETAAETSVRFEVFTRRYPEQHIRLKDRGKVQLAPDDEARALAEIETIRALKRHWRAAERTETDFSLPVHGRRSSRFGLRRFFNGEPRAPHVGLDIAVPRGAPVQAGSPGEVLAVSEYFFNGKTVFVDHGNGLISMYCHLDRIDVRAGESVARGQALGVSGMTGRASGPHLHWSVILNGAMVDPELFVP